MGLNTFLISYIYYLNHIAYFESFKTCLAIQVCIAFMKNAHSNSYDTYSYIIENSLFTNRQIDIIFKKLNTDKTM